jgi:hypothetical protein
MGTSCLQRGRAPATGEKMLFALMMFREVPWTASLAGIAGPPRYSSGGTLPDVIAPGSSLALFAA